MEPAEPRRPRVSVTPATAEQEPVLANLLELYAHDLSAHFDVPLGPDGRFGYPHLPSYWREEGRHPFLVHVDGELAGLVLVSRGSRVTGDPDVHDVAEFFVARRHRRRGAGTAMAHDVWRRFPGRWEVRVLETYEPAVAFWREAVHAFAPSTLRETVVEVDARRWRLFSFVSPGTGETLHPYDEP